MSRSQAGHRCCVGFLLCQKTLIRCCWRPPDLSQLVGGRECGAQGGDPIRFNSNPATINGVMFEIEKAMKRTGDVHTCFQHLAVELSNGGLAIDSSDAIAFIEGTFIQNGPKRDTSVKMSHNHTKTHR